MKMSPTLWSPRWIFISRLAMVSALFASEEQLLGLAEYPAQVHGSGSGDKRMPRDRRCASRVTATSGK